MTCLACPFWRRLFCIVACPEMSAVFDAIDLELKGEG